MNPPRFPTSHRPPPAATPSPPEAASTTSPALAAPPPQQRIPSPTRHGLPLRRRGGSRYEAPRGVAPQQAQLAVYLAARSIDGRPIEGQTLQRLQDADTAVQWTRCKLKHGRGNVSIDIDATASESYRRCSVAQTFRKYALPPSIPNAGDRLSAGDAEFADCAAVAVASGAGVCDDFTSLAIGGYGPRHAEGDVVVRAGSDEAQHAWAEIHYQPAAPSFSAAHTPATVITMDGWAQGPALLNEDRSAAYDVDAEQLACYGPQQTTAFLDRIKSTLQRVGPPISAVMPHDLSRLEADGSKLPRRVFEPCKLFDAEFAARVQEHMAHGPQGVQALRSRVMAHVPDAMLLPAQRDVRTATDRRGNSLRDQLAAVSAARAMGANVAGAMQQTPAILDAVRDLPDIPNVPHPARSR